MEFFNTTVTPKAISLATRVLESGFLSEGKMVLAFEKALSEQLGLVHPIAVNSGTSALHLALIGAGVQDGDEVITSAQTFIASSLAVKYCRATPVFADIDPFTGNLDPKSVLSKITDKTKAILTIHWAGYPSNLYELQRIAFINNLRLIEDAAHALGATYNELPIGNTRYSDFVCFSTQAIKHLTTGGDGGIVCCRSAGDYEYLKELRWFGINREKDTADELGERQYLLKDYNLGFKYHLNDTNAAIGLGNLDGIHERLMQRRINALNYDMFLKDVPGVKLMKYKIDRISAHWLYPILVEKRLDFVRMMKSKNIPVSVVHRRIDRHPLFGGIQEDLVGQTYFDEHQIHLPIHDKLTDEDIDTVIEAIKGGW